MKTVIFACVHNAGRSQMAAAFFNHLAGPSARAISAGTGPGTRVHPEVIAVMNEVVWRNFSTDFWVAFKVWGTMPITILFTLAQMPLVMRYSVEPPEEGTAP